MTGAGEAQAAEGWIASHVSPTGPVEVVHLRPWSTVMRIPVPGGFTWFKACGSIQGFEAGLTSALSTRWPDRVTEVIACDTDRSWLLMADAGIRIGDLANPPELWLSLLPRYAELQRGEAAHVAEHLACGVPDLRLRSLPARYDDMLRADLPLPREEREMLRGFARRFEDECAELAACGLPDSIQHDDLHMNNVHVRDGHLRVLDWGDSSVSHPFMSLVATFRFLEESNGFAPGDPWFSRLRDCYLEPWGRNLTRQFDLALRVGAFAHAIASLRQRAALSGAERNRFDEDLTPRLKRALSVTSG